MYCKNCGTKVNQNDKYCTSCGNEINKNNNSNYNTPKPKETNVSLILGIIACCLFFIPFISIPLSIISIILGIINRKEQKLIGVILGITGLILTIVMIVSIVLLFRFIINEEVKPYLESEFEELIEEQFEISGNTFIASDNSLVKFSDDGSYYWTPKEENNSNYNKGNYTVYTGTEAYNYAKYNLAGFNYYEYDINEFYLIIMRPTEIMVNGTIIPETNAVYYYGEYDRDDRTLELYNHNTGKELNLTLYNDVSNNIDI